MGYPQAWCLMRQTLMGRQSQERPAKRAGRAGRLGRLQYLRIPPFR